MSSPLKSGSGLPTRPLLAVLALALMVRLSISQSNLIAQPSSPSTVYIIKFFKATTDEIRALSDATSSTANKKLLTELQFLEKLVRNTNDVLS